MLQNVQHGTLEWQCCRTLSGVSRCHYVPTCERGTVCMRACTGGEIASTFDDPGKVKLGHCKLIEEIMIGEDKLIHFSGTAMGEACTVVLRGASACSSR